MTTFHRIIINNNSVLRRRRGHGCWWYSSSSLASSASSSSLTQRQDTGTTTTTIPSADTRAVAAADTTTTNTSSRKDWMNNIIRQQQQQQSLIHNTSLNNNKKCKNYQSALFFSTLGSINDGNSMIRQRQPTATRRSITVDANVANDDLEDEDVETTKVMIDKLLSVALDNHKNDASSSSSFNTTPFDCYQIFDIPYLFHIDTDLLKLKYHQFMKVLHPDIINNHYRSNVSSSNQAMVTVEDLAHTLNSAYDVLKQRHLRAVNLLEIMGYSFDDTNITSEMVGQDFLFSIFELHETMDDIILHLQKIQQEATQNNKEDLVKQTWYDNPHQRKLQEMYYENQTRMDETCNQFATALDHYIISKNDNDGSKQTYFDSMIRLTGQLQYWNRLNDKISEHIEWD